MTWSSGSKNHYSFNNLLSDNSLVSKTSVTSLIGQPLCLMSPLGQKAFVGGTWPPPQPHTFTTVPIAHPPCHCLCLMFSIPSTHGLPTPASYLGFCLQHSHGAQYCRVVEHHPSPTQTPCKYYPNTILEWAQSSNISFFKHPSTPSWISFIKYTSTNIFYILVSLHPAQNPQIKSILEGRQFFEIPFFRKPSIAIV